MRQLQLDALIRSALQADERVVFALAYGSLTQGSGDEFSDVEYYAFTTQDLDAVLWLEEALKFSSFRILHSVINEFGTPNIIVSDSIRIELHVQPVEGMPDILNWPNEHIDPARMLVKDQEGKLHSLLEELAARPKHDPADDAQLIFDRALNWLVFGWNVLKRGERARALELLRWLQASLLRLARLQEGQTAHWLNPYRRAEKELSPETMDRYASLTGGVDDLEKCYWAAWRWLRELADTGQVHFAADFRTGVTVTLAE